MMLTEQLQYINHKNNKIRMLTLIEIITKNAEATFVSSKDSVKVGKTYVVKGDKGLGFVETLILEEPEEIIKNYFLWLALDEQLKTLLFVYKASMNSFLEVDGGALNDFNMSEMICKYKHLLG